MRRHDLDLTSLIAGTLFVGLGLVFLSDERGLLDVEVRWVWPALLIGLGIALLASNRAGESSGDPEPRAEPGSRETPEEE